jgi:quercetin dioxygenase-like cupin family protein
MIHISLEDQMIKTGNVIENPITGERIEFLQTAEDTGGTLLQLMLTVKPGGFVAAPHIHPKQEERFMVKSGTIRLQVDEEEQLLSAGQEGRVPPGMTHVWWNGGADELKALVEFRPALRTQDTLSTIFALARDGKTNKMGVPNLLQIAVTVRKYGGNMYLAKPPIVVQKLLFASIAWIGRLLGYRGDYPYRSELSEKETRAVDTGMASATIDGRG